MTPTKKESRKRNLAGALAGVLAGAAGVAVAEAVAALPTGVTSPLLAVANRAVDETPRPLKEFAIETFGSADKAVLIGSVIATVALLAAMAGVLGVRRPPVAVGVFLLLSAVAAAAAITDRSATASTGLRILPVLALVVTGLVAVLLLIRPLRTSPADRSRIPAEPSKGPPTQGTTSVETLESGKHRVLLRDHVDGDELPAAFDRRSFLKAALAVSAVAAAGGLVSRQFGDLAAAASRASVTIPQPSSAAAAVAEGVSLDIPGITPFLTPNETFYRVDTALRVPDVPVESFTLRIHGMVDKELELSYEDLLSRRLVERRITITCVSNPVGGDLMGNATWIGFPMHELLAEAGVQDGADAVKSTSADDFTIGTPLPVLLDKEREALVAVAMNGEPLPIEHGFPVRMVTPGLYGYVSATKWLIDLEVTRFADFKAYWTTRGYSAEAPIKTSSRIDVPKSFARVKAGKTPVAGVAWSQDRGIEKVEVRVDDEDWAEARLAGEDSINTWRQWVLDWDATPGSHKLEVRATDSTGYTQTSRREPIAPNGSTGWDSVDVIVE